MDDKRQRSGYQGNKEQLHQFWGILLYVRQSQVLNVLPLRFLVLLYNFLMNEPNLCRHESFVYIKGESFCLN